jgi:hypothetical protein
MGLFFSYPVLLWGLLAGSIPLLIHLLRRRRVTTQPLPTLRFLTEAHRQQRFNIQLQDLLLLILRTLLILLVVMALAGPKMVLGGRAQGILGWMNAGEARRVALVDVSRSMGYEEAGSSRLNRAAEAVSRLMDELPQSAEAMVIPFSDGGEEDERALPASFSRDRDLWKRQLDLLQSSDRETRVSWALQRANEFLADAADGSVFLLTDLQRTGWEDLLARQTSPQEFPFPISVIDVSLTPSRNAWIEALTLPALPLAAGEPGQIRVEAAAAGYPAGTDLPLKIELFQNRDGENNNSEPLAARELLLKSGASQAVTLPVTPGSPGDWQGVVRLSSPEIDDPLPADNEARFQIRVRDAIPCLILMEAGESDREVRFLQTCLRLALAASEMEGASPAFDVKFADPAQGPPSDLGSPAVVIVHGPPALSGEWQSRLGRVVREGGGMLLFLDPQWPEDSSRQGAEKDRFAWLTGLGIESLPKPIPSAAGAGMKVENWEHPAMRVFLPVGRDLFDSVRVWQPVALSSEQSSLLASMRLTSATDAPSIQPIAVEKQLDSGRAILCGVPLRPSASNLATSAVWVPLLQQWVKYLATPAEALPDRAPRSLLARESDLAPLSPSERDALAAKLPISFSTLDRLPEAIARGQGSRDLTGLFLFLAVLMGVVEVFLSNRMV